MNESLPTRIQRVVLDSLRTILDLFFHRGKTGAVLRSLLGVVSLGLYWTAVTVLTGFPALLSSAWLEKIPFPVDLILDLGASYFAPDVLLFVIPVLAGYWFAMRIGAHYLADLFELESYRIGARFLRAAILGMGYDTIEISTREGLELNPSSPLQRIGGPGYLTVHLGFAVVSETIDGLPRVYGASKEKFLQGFERLREVVDLRDQLRKLDEIRTVTRDGIVVYARDAQMVFRVYRGGKTSTLGQPYPFDENAIRKLVYGQAVLDRGSRKWDQQLPSLVRREIQQFVSQLSIEEFLALQPEYPSSIETPDPVQPSAVIHIPRSELTARFHTEEARERLQKVGLELDWVGVGTWEIKESNARTPSSSSPARTIINTWQNLQRSAIYESEAHLKRVQRRSYQQYSGQRIREWIGAWDEPAPQIGYRKWRTLRRILDHLESMRRGLTGDPDYELPLNYDEMLKYLREKVGSLELGD